MPSKFPQPCVFCGSTNIVVADARFGRPAYGEKLWTCASCGMFMDEHDWDKTVERDPRW